MSEIDFLTVAAILRFFFDFYCFVFSDSYGTCRIAMKAFDQTVEMSSYVDFEQLVKQSLVPNRFESFTKIYETSIVFFLMVVDIFIY